MKFPKSADDVKDEILITLEKNPGTQKLRVKQLKTVLQKADKSIIFDGLMQAFEESSIKETSYEAQEVIGTLLLDLNPKPNLDLDEILKRTLPIYNLSIEQLPFYLRDNFPINDIRNSLNKFKNGSLDPKTIKAAETFEYWLEIKK